MSIGTADSRFDAKVDRNGTTPAERPSLGPCWEWIAGKTAQGYGGFHPSKREMVLAHRYSYERARGPIPEGMVIDHLCRNRTCVNPAHLEPVTNLENLSRGAGYAVLNGMRGSCLNGHQYIESNIYTPPNGSIRCRTCAREHDRIRARERGIQPRTLKPINLDEVRRMYGEGYGATRISADLRVGINRVYEAMEILGLPRRPAGRVTRKAA